MLIHKTLEFLPVKGPALAPAVQPFVHDAHGLPDEHFKRSVIERHAIIAKVAAYLGAERARACRLACPQNPMPIRDTPIIYTQLPLPRIVAESRAMLSLTG